MGRGCRGGIHRDVVLRLTIWEKSWRSRGQHVARLRDAVAKPLHPVAERRKGINAGIDTPDALKSKSEAMAAFMKERLWHELV